MAVLGSVVRRMRRTRVIREDSSYLYAEFKSRLLGYVDDVEFSLSETEGVIQVRSASRLGRRDYGVNRARVEAVRLRFAAAQTRPTEI